MDTEMPKELQESVLMIGLGNGESHGYELGEYLRSNHLPLDLATVYRRLQSMERRGLITSRWDSSASGPARRVYSLTELGFTSLRSEILQLRTLQNLLGELLEAAEVSQLERDRTKASARA
jgi:DNA-binding PadR family transcriptional regulator